MTNTHNYDSLTKAQKFEVASMVLKDSSHEYASELAKTLLEESERINRANARNRGKKRISKAQKERAQVVEQLVEVLGNSDTSIYYDSVGLLTLIDLDYTPQKAIHVAKDLVEQGLLVDIDNQEFADGKSRKAYALQKEASQAYDSE